MTRRIVVIDLLVAKVIQTLFYTIIREFGSLAFVVAQIVYRIVATLRAWAVTLIPALPI